MELQDAARRIVEEQRRITKVLEDAGYMVLSADARIDSKDLYLVFHPDIIMDIDCHELGANTAPTTQSQ